MCLWLEAVCNYLLWNLFDFVQTGFGQLFNDANCDDKAMCKDYRTWKVFNRHTYIRFDSAKVFEKSIFIGQNEVLLYLDLYRI